MRFKTFFILLLTVHSFFVSAQGEFDFWYFGYNAGLNFPNQGNPVAVTDGQLYTTESCASISDAAGNFLFYTDGITVWDKSHAVMPNGTGLNGHESSTQILIIQKPGNTYTYYIFTTDAFAGAKGICYSEVDMTLNAGKGDITLNKNIRLTPIGLASEEKLAAVRHCNGKDIWVLTHDFNSDAFRVFSVTSVSVNPIPVVSNAGLSTSNSIGQLKISPDGRKLATGTFNIGLQLFDFNNSTGVVANGALLENNMTAYGVEFSPDGTKLYYTNFTSNLYQYNLCAGNDAAIIASKSTITAPVALRSLQIGPNKKIYVTYGDYWLGVIDNPNALGAGCSYVHNGVSLGTQLASLGLPGFISSYFKPFIPSFTTTVNCLMADFVSPTVNISNCSGSTNAIASLEWNFNDPASGVNNTATITNPNHTYTSAGTYTVVLLVNYSCGTDTLKQQVTIIPCSQPVTVTITNAEICKGSCVTLSAAIEEGALPFHYQWSNGNTNSFITVCPTLTIVYTLTVSDNSSNEPAIATVTVTVNPLPEILVTPLGIVTIESGESVALSAYGGVVYQWAPETDLSCTNCANPTANPGNTTVYCVTATDANGCSDNACVTVAVATDTTCIEVYIPTAFSPDNDRNNDLFCIYGANCLQSFTFIIYDRWGERVFETNDFSRHCWDGIYKAKAMTEALFYYIFEGIYNREQISKKGTIVLIR